MQAAICGKRKTDRSSWLLVSLVLRRGSNHFRQLSYVRRDSARFIFGQHLRCQWAGGFVLRNRRRRGPDCFDRGPQRLGGGKRRGAIENVTSVIAITERLICLLIINSRATLRAGMTAS